MPTRTSICRSRSPAATSTRRGKAEIVERLGIGDRLRHRPHELSGGQRRRVAVARALLTKPDVVFADEPTGNLDSLSGAEVLDLLHAAAAQYGQTIIMVTHDPVAAAHADRVVLRSRTVVWAVRSPTRRRRQSSPP